MPPPRRFNGRETNRFKVLRALYTHPGSTRTELARYTALSRPTVSAVADELVQAGGGGGPRGAPPPGGRPPRGPSPGSRPRVPGRGGTGGPAPPGAGGGTPRRA